ncbi:MAG: hypothetical protein QF632_07035 [Candidatus Woesearchaeota archaeon]|jgi:tetrahydromethanopterin S-methyltransferase subunit E|nr:hypothetical protein [Candidatus Woesearchaeota archaeon]MDP7324489.1 hypothetical protein [Candidatus Woesearchaeota archaeon]MDP7458275.1 hypothetical protein [Candidatus Woesearchaeota archaeon]
MESQDSKDIEFVGGKIGYCFGIVVFISIFYLVSAKYWFLGRFNYRTVILGIVGIYCLIIIIKAVLRKH